MAIQITAPDLIVSAATGPSLALGGDMIELSYTVTNNGDGPAVVGWTDRIYLSPSPLYNSKLLLEVDAQSWPPLAPGESYIETHQVTLPPESAGAQYLRFVTDIPDQQPESDDQNNVRVLPIELTTTDLVVSEATAPAAAVVGQTIPVTWTVQNVGTTPASRSWHDAIYVSDNTTLGATDTLVAMFSSDDHPVLGAGGAYTWDQPVTLPSTAVGDPVPVVCGGCGRPAPRDE